MKERERERGGERGTKNWSIDGKEIFFIGKEKKQHLETVLGVVQGRTFFVNDRGRS